MKSNNTTTIIWAIAYFLGVSLGFALGWTMRG